MIYWSLYTGHWRDKSKQKSDQASVFIALQMVVRVSVINNLTLEEKMIEQSSS